MFNNIAWGKSSDLSTAWATRRLSRRCSASRTPSSTTPPTTRGRLAAADGRRGRDKFLGNVWQSIGHRVFRHSEPAETRAAGKAAHRRGSRERYALESNAFAFNVFQDVASYGVLEPSGRWLAGLDEFKQALSEHGALSSDLGRQVSKAPLPGAKDHDFTPGPDSPALDSGVRAFVPWALFGVVAEWNFHPAGGRACASPTTTGI